jgi:hypothetical protein
MRCNEKLSIKPRTANTAAMTGAAGTVISGIKVQVSIKLGFGTGIVKYFREAWNIREAQTTSNQNI